MSPFAVLLLATSVVAALVGLGVVATGWARRRAGWAPRDPRDPVWTATTPPPRSDDPPSADCDWAVWWDLGDGKWRPLRHPVGRSCCHVVVTVRELTPDVSCDERREALGWTGERTRIGMRQAVTPTARDVVVRHATARDGGVGAGVALERTPGPTVVTPARRRAAGHAPSTASTPADEAAQLWACHVDDLRDRGAGPVPAEGPSVAPDEVRRRVEVVVRVQRGCGTRAVPVTVDARVRARLSGTASPGAATMAAPTLASWVTVDGRVVAADAPTTAPTGLASWSRVTTEAGPAIDATALPFGPTCDAEWSGRWAGAVDPSVVRLVAGSTVALAIDGLGNGAVPASARLDATTTAQVRIHVGDATRDGTAAACPRCLPRLVLHIGPGTDTPARPDAHGATWDGTIGWDGRVLRLRAPAAGSDHPAWTVDAVDTDDVDTGRRPAAHRPIRSEPLGWRPAAPVPPQDRSAVAEVDRTVVLVDDEEDHRFVLRRTLERKGGFRVVAEGTTGQTALDLVTEHRPHVLLLDLGLPDVEDIELVPRLLVAAPHTMVAVLTGRAAEDREARLRAVGAFTYYEKGMMGQGLLDYLEQDWDLFQRALAGEDVVAPSAITRRRP